MITYHSSFLCLATEAAQLSPTVQKICPAFWLRSRLYPRLLCKQGR